MAFQFERKGRIQVTALPESGDPEAFFEQLFDVAAESGAEDVKVVEEDDEKLEVIYEVCPTFGFGATSLRASCRSSPHLRSYPT